DMPESPIRGGGRFLGPSAELAELARWYDRGLDVLASAPATPIRIWPHHFDLGSIIYLDAATDGRQIGLGLSPGDKYYAEPYFYVTPSPTPKDARSAELPSGTWRREGWTGAVLRGSEISAGADPKTFLHAAIAAARALTPAAS